MSSKKEPEVQTSAPKLPDPPATKKADDQDAGKAKVAADEAAFAAGATGAFDLVFQTLENRLAVYRAEAATGFVVALDLFETELRDRIKAARPKAAP